MNASLLNHITNFAIIAAVVALGILLQNPLTMFGLIYLRDVPILVSSEEDEGQEESGTQIGFITN